MEARRYPGFFISLEGIEGAGKTTQARRLAEKLNSQGLTSLLTQEPGGTGIGRQIRQILLRPDNQEMSFMTELLLYNADRAQHLFERIVPALESGVVVITDRFSDSTMAYQGFGRGIEPQIISALDRLATGGFRPDLTILFNLDPQAGLTRNRDINKVDRIELEDIEFHRRVAEGFKSLADREPDRFAAVDAADPIDAVAEKVWAAVQSRLKTRGLI